MAFELIKKRVVGHTKFEVLKKTTLFGNQKFHVRISDLNGNILFHSEKLENEDYAIELMDKAAAGAW